MKDTIDEMKNQRILTLLTRGEREKIQKRAAEEDRSLSAMIRRCVLEYLARIEEN